jgi:vacuolar protein sorting-associated protein 45
VVFIQGGATYEEAKEISVLNTRLQGLEVVLGGTHIHNSKSFLAEIYQQILARNLS